MLLGTLLWLGATQGPLEAALALEQRGDDAQAVEAVSRLVRADPAAVLPRLEAARLLLKQGSALDAAEWHADVARSLAPENPRAHFLWALVCEERGRRGEARASLEVALALRADYADAQYRLAGLKFAAADYAGASALYRSYLDARPDALGARLQLADALERSNRLDKAERELRSILKATPGQPVASRRLAELLERSGRATEAAHVRAAAEGPPRKLRALKPSNR
jgi:tetratricopeptide (TPR) repeat protein